MRLKSGLSYASFRNINFISTVMNYSVCYPVIINMYQICNIYVLISMVGVLILFDFGECVFSKDA